MADIGNLSLSSSIEFNISCICLYVNSILFTTHEIQVESPPKTQLFCFTEKFDVHLEVELAQASFSLARAGRQEQEHESGWEFFGVNFGHIRSNWVNLGYSDLIWVKIGHNRPQLVTML